MSQASLGPLWVTPITWLNLAKNSHKDNTDPWLGND